MSQSLVIVYSDLDSLVLNSDSIPASSLISNNILISCSAYQILWQLSKCTPLLLVIAIANYYMVMTFTNKKVHTATSRYYLGWNLLLHVCTFVVKTETFSVYSYCL